MNRAFVSENDGWNLCLKRNKHCRDATMRGECELAVCKYGPEPEEESEKEKKGHP